MGCCRAMVVQFVRFLAARSPSAPRAGFPALGGAKTLSQNGDSGQRRVRDSGREGREGDAAERQAAPKTPVAARQSAAPAGAADWILAPLLVAMVTRGAVGRAPATAPAAVPPR